MKTCRKVASKGKTGKSPESGIEIVTDNGERLELRDGTRDEAILGFCATVGLEREKWSGELEGRGTMDITHLTLVKSGLVDFILQLLGNLGPLQHTILTECQPVLQKILAQAERDDERLPGETWAIKPSG